MGHNPSHLSTLSPAEQKQQAQSTDSTITAAVVPAPATAAAPITITSEAWRDDGATVGGSGQSSRRRAPSLIGASGGSGAMSSRFSVSFDTADTTYPTDSHEHLGHQHQGILEEGERSRHILSTRKNDSPVVPSPQSSSSATNPRNASSSSWSANRAISTTSEGSALSEEGKRSTEMSSNNDNYNNRCGCEQGEVCTCFRQSHSLHNLHHDGTTTAVVRVVRRRDNPRGVESKASASLSVPASGRTASSTPSRSPSQRSSRPAPITLPSQVLSLPKFRHMAVVDHRLPLENAKGDLAGRVFSRMAHKREDFGRFCANLSGEEWNAFLSEFREVLNEVVVNLQNAGQVKEVSMNFGRRQVQRRAYGFKADFFSTLADAMTTECVFLDAAAHSTTETIEAWSELAGVIFTHIRDGYYEQVRCMRKNASVSRNSSMGQSSDDHSSTSTQVSTLSIPSSQSVSRRIPRQHSVGEDRRSVTPTRARGM